MILITAFDDDGRATRAFELGVTAFFHKPFECGSSGGGGGGSHRQGSWRLAVWRSSTAAGRGDGGHGLLVSEAPTVFIVDDDTSVRNGARAAGAPRRMERRSSASAREFIDRYDPAQPGCLVLDVSMPEVDGLELQSHLRQLV